MAEFMILLLTFYLALGINIMWERMKLIDAKIDRITKLIKDMDK
jgi:hypothetical protein